MKEKIKGFCNRIIDNEKTTIKEYILRLLLGMVFALLGALFLVTYSNREKYALSESEKGLIEIPFYQKDDKSYVAEFDECYIDKLQYEFDGIVSFSANLIFQNTNTGEQFVVSDYNNMYLNTSVHKVCGVYNKVTIDIANEILEGDDPTVVKMWINNEYEFNYVMFIIFFMAIFTCIMLVLCLRLFTNKPEFAFLVCVIAIGISYIFILPNQKVGWDEGYHFTTAYRLSVFDSVPTNEGIKIHGNDDAVWPLIMPVTFEEGELINDYLNTNLEISNQETLIYDKSIKPALNNIIYWPSAIGIGLGRLFGCSFVTIFELGRLFNLLAYVTLVFFAIKRCPVGKMLMTVLALMPTLMTVATVYSRDAVINGLSLFAISHFLNMYLDKSKPVTWKGFLIYEIVVGIVCLTKPVYAPFMLLLLLIPKERFKSNKEALMTKLFMVVVPAVLAAVGILALVAVRGTGLGDSRGGNTDGNQQLAYIMEEPFRYIKLLFNSIYDNFVEYSVGPSAMALVGHVYTVTTTKLIKWLLIIIAITDICKEAINWKMKLGFATVYILCAVLIWTSMYLSFTEIGAGTIAGVQGRYFIPMVFPLLLLLNFSKLKLNINKTLYCVLSVGTIALLEFWQLHLMILTFCG